MMTTRSFLGLAGIAAAFLFLAPSCSDDGEDGGGTGGTSMAGRGGSGMGGSAGANMGGSAGAGMGGSAGAGMGGSAGAGMGGSGMGGSAGASMTGAALSFEDDVFPILQAECGRCHASAFAGNDAADAYEIVSDPSSDYYAEDIVDAIDTGAMPLDTCNGGDPGDNGCVSVEDFETIADWVELDGLPE